MFIKRKSKNRHSGQAQRVSCALWSFESFIQGFLPDFLWPIILLCLVLSLYLVYLPYVHAHLVAKIGVTEEGRLTSLPF